MFFEEPFANDPENDEEYFLLLGKEGEDNGFRDEPASEDEQMEEDLLDEKILRDFFSDGYPF